VSETERMSGSCMARLRESLHESRQYRIGAGRVPREGSKARIKENPTLFWSEEHGANAESVRVLLGVSVGCFGRFLQFVVHLLEEFFRFLSMSVHVPLVGLLCFDDLFIGLRGKALCRGQVRMAQRTDIVFRLF